MDGSFRDVISESARNIKRDEMTVKYQGQLQALNFEIEAQQSEFQASIAKTGAVLNAASSILGAGAQAASFSKLSSSRVPNTPKGS